jgi:transposase
MKKTRKRYSAEFKARVALEAIRGGLTLAELAAKHSIHHTMIAAWNRQAVEGMAGTFSGASDAARAASEAEVEKLTRRSDNWSWSAIFSQSLRSMSVARRRSMIEPAHQRVLIAAQSGCSRSAGRPITMHRCRRVKRRWR